MHEVFGAHYSSLHVRVTNRGAFHLYHDTLQYAIHDREEGYYADGEDAYDMRKTFGDFSFGKKGPKEAAAGGGREAAAGPAANKNAAAKKR
jgi:peptide alpha-N-acetyltransferase